MIAPRAGGPHRPDPIAATEENPIQIDPMHRPPVRKGGMLGIMGDHSLFKTGDAGIVHQHVYSRKRQGKPLPIRLDRHVEMDEPAAQPVGDGLPAGIVLIRDDDDCALAGKGRCNRLSDATPRARHDAHLVLQSTHSVFLTG